MGVESLGANVVMLEDTIPLPSPQQIKLLAGDEHLATCQPTKPPRLQLSTAAGDRGFVFPSSPPLINRLASVVGRYQIAACQRPPTAQQRGVSSFSFNPSRPSRAYMNSRSL